MCWMRADNKVSMRFILSTSRTERTLAVVATMQNVSSRKSSVSPSKTEAKIRSILKTEGRKVGPIDIISG